MRIAVVGTGAVGAYFGGRLAQAGEEVAFVARGEHMRAMRESGLRVESANGDIDLRPVRVTDAAATVGPVDVVLLTVKGWQVPRAIETLRPLMGAGTIVVPLLNGVEAPDQLAEVFGAAHVAGGLCRLFGSTVGPGHFRNTMAQPYIAFGGLDTPRGEHIEPLRQAFERAGVQVEIVDDIRVALWEKLMFVGPFGGVGAVTRAPVGVMRAQPETRALLEGATVEIGEVARARGVRVPEDAVGRALALIDGSPAQATASMQRDIMAGRPSELESQIGVVVRWGGEAGVAVPRHSALYASLLPQERQARGEIVFPA